jgi:uncharacterized OsmC-like protein
MSLISIKHESALRVKAEIRGHKVVLDVPENLGGADTGPEPVELFTAALGACMAMHVAKYCQTAKLPHEGFEIDLDFQVVKGPLRVGSVMVDIRLPPDFPESRVEAVKRAAQQCTVKNTLKETTAVDVEVYRGA